MEKIGLDECLHVKGLVIVSIEHPDKIGEGGIWQILSSYLNTCPLLHMLN